MNRYGQDTKGIHKEELYNNIEDFVSNYGLAELLKIVTDYIEYHEYNEAKKEK